MALRHLADPGFLPNLHEEHLDIPDNGRVAGLRSTHPPRIFDPRGLPLLDATEADHPKVQELRELSLWSEGQVWCSPERHGNSPGCSRARSTGCP